MLNIDPDVAEAAYAFGVDPRLIQAVVRAEGDIVRAVQCSLPAVTTRAEALRVTARSALHALSDFYLHGAGGTPADFVRFWGARWAPVGSADDPRNLNANWVPNVLVNWRPPSPDAPSPTTPAPATPAPAA